MVTHLVGPTMYIISGGVTARPLVDWSYPGGHIVCHFEYIYLCAYLTSVGF